VIYFAIRTWKKESTLPLYEYQCLKCRRRTEKIENVSGPHLKKCPHCGGKVEALLSAPAIQFKGSGWYVTDYAGKKASSDSGAGKDEKPTTDTKDAATKDSAKESSTKDSSKDKKTEKPAKKK
jgi:putative FmdB family regulatory protein